MPIDAFETIPDAQANLNFKVFTDASAGVALLMSQNAAAHQHRVNAGAENMVNAWGNRVVSTDPIEAVANMNMLTGRSSQGIAESVALAQQLMKGAQTTPPRTD